MDGAGLPVVDASKIARDVTWVSTSEVLLYHHLGNLYDPLCNSVQLPYWQYNLNDSKLPYGHIIRRQVPITDVNFTDCTHFK